MDKYGTRKMFFFSSIAVAVGQGIFVLGVIIGSFGLAVLGRAILGCGSQNLGSAGNIFIIKWLAGKELSMGFGVNISLNLFCIALNANTSPRIVEYTGSLDLAVIVGLLLCILSVITAVVVIAIDKNRDDLVAGIAMIEAPMRRVFKCSDMKKLKLLFWLLVGNIIFVDCSIFSFDYISSKYYQERFGYSSSEAGSIISLPYVVVTLFTPFIGILVDKYGKRGIMLIVAAALITLFQLLLLITPDSDRPIFPILYLILFGLGFSILSTVFWAALGYIMDPSLLGTANGAVYSARNIGLVIVPIIVGYLKDNTQQNHGFFWVSVFLGLLSGLGIINGIIIYIYDLRQGGILHSSDPAQAQINYMKAKGDKVGSFLEYSVNFT